MDKLTKEEMNIVKKYEDVFKMIIRNQLSCLVSLNLYLREFIM